jgi:hypothetical protein
VRGSSSSSDVSGDDNDNKAPEGPASVEQGDRSILAAFDQLEPGHCADTLVKIEKIRASN